MTREEREEVAIEAVVDILRAVCAPGDELAAEEILRRAKMQFVQEGDALE